MGRQERRDLRPGGRRRRLRHQARPRQAAARRQDGGDRPLRGRQEGHPPAGRSAPAHQGDGPRRRRRRGDLRHPRRRGQAERPRGVQRDAAHLQHLDGRFLQPLSRPPHRPRLPALRRHRRRRRRGAPRRQAGLQGHRAVVLVGHGADVAPACGSRCGQAINEVEHPAALPHLPVGVAEAARAVHRAHPARAHVQQPLPVPDDARQHPHRADGPRGVRALPEPPHRASARAASAGSPTCSTAWTSSTRTSTRTCR